VDLAPGLAGQATLVVGNGDTAAALGSGDVDVLATPRVLALCEAATVAAVRAALDAGETTVGTHVELDHLRPSAVAARVTASATLTSVDGRRLTFDVEAVEGAVVVARGIVVRAVVDRERFVSR
jgi:fluoroacetyl-CoA thioesterase